MFLHAFLLLAATLTGQIDPTEWATGFESDAPGSTTLTAIEGHAAFGGLLAGVRIARTARRHIQA